MPLHNTAYYYGLLAAQKSLFNHEERTKLKDAILEAVHQDPLIRDKVNIAVTLPADDEKSLALEGKVSDEKQKERLKEIAVNRTPTDIKIYDSVIVEA